LWIIFPSTMTLISCIASLDCLKLDEHVSQGELLLLKGCLVCGQHNRCGICMSLHKKAQHHKICNQLCKYEDFKCNISQWEIKLSSHSMWFHWKH
jgi:hypothetical protein